MTYDGGEDAAVKGVSLAIEDGEFFVLVGPSGCGKSTLLRLLAGLEFPSSGAIWLDGEDATERAPSAARERLPHLGSGETEHRSRRTVPAVVDPVVGVRGGADLPHPGPHHVGGGRHGDPAPRLEDRVEDEVVAAVVGRHLGVDDAPPVSDHRPIVAAHRHPPDDTRPPPARTPVPDTASLTTLGT
jgi:energy-coupling factor transporter ATP-binding protein EcfA2